MRAYEDEFATETADAFCDTHPQLMTRHILRLFIPRSAGWIRWRRRNWWNGIGRRFRGLAEVRTYSRLCHRYLRKKSPLNFDAASNMAEEKSQTLGRAVPAPLARKQRRVKGQLR